MNELESVSRDLYEETVKAWHDAEVRIAELLKPVEGRPEHDLEDDAENCIRELNAYIDALLAHLNRSESELAIARDLIESQREALKGKDEALKEVLQLECPHVAETAPTHCVTGELREQLVQLALTPSDTTQDTGE